MRNNVWKEIALLLIAFILLALAIIFFGAGMKRPTQKDSFFVDNRFILVDKDRGNFSSLSIDRVYADKVTGVMYLYTYNSGVGLTPLYNSDGSLMIYDIN